MEKELIDARTRIVLFSRHLVSILRYRDIAHKLQQWLYVPDNEDDDTIDITADIQRLIDFIGTCDYGVFDGQNMHSAIVAITRNTDVEFAASTIVPLITACERLEAELSACDDILTEEFKRRVAKVREHCEIACEALCVPTSSNTTEAPTTPSNTHVGTTDHTDTETPTQGKSEGSVWDITPITAEQWQGMRDNNIVPSGSSLDDFNRDLRRGDIATWCAYAKEQPGMNNRGTLANALLSVVKWITDNSFGAGKAHDYILAAKYIKAIEMAAEIKRGNIRKARKFSPINKLFP